MAKETLPFMDALKLMKKYSYNPNLKIKEDEDYINSIFPPRYFLEMHFASNPQLAKYVNQYINYSFDMHFKLTNIQVIQLMREFSKTFNIQAPVFPKKSPKGDFKKKFDTLHKRYKHGIAKPEIEIMMLAVDKLPRRDQQEYYILGERESNKLNKMTKAELNKIPDVVSPYDNYSDYLVKSILDKKINTESCSKCDFSKNKTKYIESNIKYDINDNHVDVLILSDQPHDGKMLKTESYEILQQYIKHFNLDKMHYVIANVVMCETKLAKLNASQLKSCDKQITALIKECSPTAILALGSKVCTWLGIDASGMVNSCGTKVEYKGYDIVKSIHPSYLVKNRTSEAYDLFTSAFQEVVSIVNPIEAQEASNVNAKRPGDLICDGEIYAAKPLPKKFYKKEWILIKMLRLSVSS